MSVARDQCRFAGGASYYLTAIVQIHFELVKGIPKRIFGSVCVLRYVFLYAFCRTGMFINIVKQTFLINEK